MFHISVWPAILYFAFVNVFHTYVWPAYPCSSCVNVFHTSAWPTYFCYVSVNVFHTSVWLFLYVHSSSLLCTCSTRIYLPTCVVARIFPCLPVQFVCTCIRPVFCPSPNCLQIWWYYYFFLCGPSGHVWLVFLVHVSRLLHTCSAITFLWVLIGESFILQYYYYVYTYKLAIKSCVMGSTVYRLMWKEIGYFFFLLCIAVFWVVISASNLFYYSLLHVCSLYL